MNTCPINRRPLYVYRFKNSYGIYSSCSGSIPYYFKQSCLSKFIAPLKSQRVLWEFCCHSKRTAIRYAVICQNKTVRGKIIIFYFIGKKSDFIFYIIRSYNIMFYYIKTKFRKKIHLVAFFLKFLSFCVNKGKSIEHYVSVRGNFAVKLSYSSTAQVSWIFIYLIIIKCGINSVELCKSYYPLSP